MTPYRPRVAWSPIGSAMAAAAAVLVATSTRYDLHRDELYFRMLRPAWGYVDQPPLTPLLARAAIGVLGDSAWSIRLPAALLLALATALTALTTRELGGGAGAQALCAWGYAFAGIPMAFGHILLTAAVDLAIWAAVLLFAMRALLRDQPRWWLAVGVAAGVGLYNKYLIVLLALGVGLALLAVGPRRVLVSPWFAAGVLVALVIGAPNLVYQAANGWPQLAMTSAIADDVGTEGRVLLVPLQLILLGVLLVPIWVAGMVALLRRPEWRPVRAFAVAYPVIIAIVLVTGGWFYYPLGVLTVSFAAGCVEAAQWATRGSAPRGEAARESAARESAARESAARESAARESAAGGSAARRWLLGAAVAVNAAMTLVLSLPLLPVTVIGDTPIPGLNQAIRDQVGWPTYTRQVADVYRELPPEQAANAVIITDNYGEAGALSRYGQTYRLPKIYSGDRELHRYGPPPEQTTTVIAVGLKQWRLRRWFERCDPMATLDNKVGVDNEEQGELVAVCRGPRRPWPVLWPELGHLS